MVEIKYFELNSDSVDGYINLLQGYHKNNAIQRYRERGDWYRKKGGYKILLAYIDGEMLGQSTAYQDVAIVKGKEMEIWWGVDSFVLAKARGKGLGKLLQKKLHEDLPNFSSAWYSPTNGHIKRLCGATELFEFSFYYYPVSSFINFFISKAQKNKQRWLRCIPRIPNLYKCFNICSMQSYTIKESPLEESLVPFIERTLHKYDFYIKRDWNYLKWRYYENPNIKFKLFTIYQKNQLVAIQICSDVINDNGFKYIYSLDTFINDETQITHKNIYNLVSTYLQSNNIIIDGIMSIQKFKWFGRFAFGKRKFLLSTLKSKILNPYLSYSDQDMVQMY